MSHAAADRRDGRCDGTERPASRYAASLGRPSVSWRRWWQTSWAWSVPFRIWSRSQFWFVGLSRIRSRSTYRCRRTTCSLAQFAHQRCRERARSSPQAGSPLGAGQGAAPVAGDRCGHPEALEVARIPTTCATLVCPPARSPGHRTGRRPRVGYPSRAPSPAAAIVRAGMPGRVPVRSGTWRGALAMDGAPPTSPFAVPAAMRVCPVLSAPDGVTAGDWSEHRARFPGNSPGSGTSLATAQRSENGPGHPPPYCSAEGHPRPY
jgi:hypothetical protein